MAGRPDKNKLWLPATVSLRGLRIGESEDVPEGFRGRVVSWGQLDQHDGLRWGLKWVGDDGLDVRHDGGLVALTVGKNEVVRKIAGRAHRRYFNKGLDELRFIRRWVRTSPPRVTDRDTQHPRSARGLFTWLILTLFWASFMYAFREEFRLLPSVMPELLTVRGMVIIGGAVWIISRLPLLVLMAYALRPARPPARFADEVIITESGYVIRMTEATLIHGERRYVPIQPVRDAFLRSPSYGPILKAASKHGLTLCPLPHPHVTYERMRPWHKAKLGPYLIADWVGFAVLVWLLSLVNHDNPPPDAAIRDAPWTLWACVLVMGLVMPAAVHRMLWSAQRSSRRMYHRHHRRDRTAA